MPDNLNTSFRERILNIISRKWVQILAWVLIILLGIIGGYWSGISSRLNAQAAAIAPQVQEQYNLGLQALEDGKYQLAIQYFIFVIEHEPAYPGVQEKYVEALYGASLSATPSIPLTPTASATPDLRGAEAIFNTVLEMIAAQDWEGAIQNLNNLREEDASYRTIDVDGLYYVALRNRGISKILNFDCTQVNLEGGLYDLALSERFGPIDSYAESIRTWTKIYITGASFWEIDWGQAMYYFGEMKDFLPNLIDGSCMSATARYYYSTYRYAERLLGDEDYCGAGLYFMIALENPPTQLTLDPSVYQGSVDLYNSGACTEGGDGGEQPPPETPVQEGTPTPTATPTPTETPTQ